MDTSNGRPTQGGSAGGGDSSMESGDWRSQLQADLRQGIVNKITDTLKRHLPYSGYEGLQELNKIAVRFEEKIYSAATSQSDYLWNISLKMLNMETRSQNPMRDAMQPHTTANSVNPSDPGLNSIIKQEMDTSNWRPTEGGSAGGDSSMESGDWRSQLQADSRQRIVNKITDTLKRHLPYSGHEGLQELNKITVSFEEKIYSAATSQSDYLRRISLKMLNMETRSQNPMRDAMRSYSTANNVNPLDPVSMVANVQNPGSPVNVADDEALVPTNDRLPLTGNNYHWDPTAFRSNYEVIVEILRGHPLYFALTTTVEVPAIYLQQVWYTIRYESDANSEWLEGQIDATPFRLTVADIREYLHLPTAIEGGRVAFEPAASENLLCTEVQALGYLGDLHKPSLFTRRNLTPIWYELFSILSRCLSSKTRGIDKCSTNFLHIFHAVAYDRHIDFAHHIWTELVQNVKDKDTSRRRSFVPYMRFLQIFIRNLMTANPTIRRHSNHPTCPQFRMYHLTIKNELENITPRQIPNSVLNYALQTARSVIAYRDRINSQASMVQSRPIGPSQEARPERREGPRTRGGSSSRGTSRVRMRGGRVRIVGASGRVKLRENEVRGSEVGRAVESASILISTPLVDTTLHDIPVVHESSESPEPGTVATDSSSSSLSDENSDSDRPAHDRARLNPNLLAESGETRRTEGVEGETRERRSKSNVVRLPQTPNSRETTSTTDLHVLQSGIEQDAVNPAAQMHTPPSHSITSQKVIVSYTHGESANTLSTSHSETTGIETSQAQPQPTTSFNALSSLEPLILIPPFARTHTSSSSIVASLSDATGTSIATPPSSGLQGLDGRPTIVNVMPAVNVGGAPVFSTVVTSTGNLSDPGVTLPEFVSREYLVGALKAIREQVTDELKCAFQSEIVDLKRLIKGKGTMTEPKFVQQPPPPPPQTAFSISELKSMLLSKILSESDAPTSTNLAQLLRMQSMPAPAVSFADLHSIKTTLRSVQSSLDELTVRVTSLETSCRTQAGTLKRRHDDRDDPDPREGENQDKRSGCY